MREDLKSILYSEEAIAQRVVELAEQIEKDYAGKELVLVGVLKGANVFMCDLMRKIDLPMSIDFIAASSYGTSTESSGVVKILKDLDHSIEGKDVIIIEDIIDTGLTLSYLMKNFKNRKAKSIEICTLLDKPERRRAPIDVKYIGYKIPDEFIVGYGIDYAEKYRNLPFIATIKEEVYK